MNTLVDTRAYTEVISSSSYVTEQPMYRVFQYETSPISFSLADQGNNTIQILKLLKCNFITSETEINNFLIKNDSIINYLQESISKIIQYFGLRQFNIEIITDPEENQETLFLEVKTRLPLMDSLRILEELRNEWLLPVVGKDITKFNIDVLP